MGEERCQALSAASSRAPCLVYMLAVFHEFAGAEVATVYTSTTMTDLTMMMTAGARAMAGGLLFLSEEGSDMVVGPV